MKTTYLAVVATMPNTVIRRRVVDVKLTNKRVRFGITGDVNDAPVLQTFSMTRKEAEQIAMAIGWRPPYECGDVTGEPDERTEHERKFSVSGLIGGSKYLGDFTGHTRDEAVNKALESQANVVSLCHQCNDNIELNDISFEKAVAHEVVPK